MPTPALTAPQQQLVTAHYALVDTAVSQLLGRMPFMSPHRDDLRQMAAIGLIRAATSHDPARGEFSPFAYACIKFELCKYGPGMTGSVVALPERYVRSKPAQPYVTDVPLESHPEIAEASSDVDTLDTHQTAVVLADRLRARLAAIHGERNANIFLARLRGERTSEVRQRHNLTRQAVSLICRRMQPSFDRLAAQIRSAA